MRRRIRRNGDGQIRAVERVIRIVIRSLPVPRAYVHIGNQGEIGFSLGSERLEKTEILQFQRQRIAGKGPDVEILLDFQFVRIKESAQRILRLGIDYFDEHRRMQTLCVNGGSDTERHTA